MVASLVEVAAFVPLVTNQLGSADIASRFVPAMDLDSVPSGHPLRSLGKENS